MDRPKAKRLKLDAAIDEEVQDDPVAGDSDALKRKCRPSLLSLDDDCCLTIFEMLSLNDLCNVSKTCKRLQELANSVFRRRHKSKLLLIENFEMDGSLILGPDESYTNCFAQYIQNVSLSRNFASGTAIGELKKFYKLKEKNGNDEADDGSDDKSDGDEVKTNDGPILTPINSLCFESWRQGLRQSHGEMLADIIQNVETVKLSNTKVQGDLHQNLLQFVPNLKTLMLWKALYGPTVKVVTPKDKEVKPNDVKAKKVKPKKKEVHWMEQTYPKLENFVWYLKEELPVEKVKKFFQLNPSIQTFSLLTKSRETIDKLLVNALRVDKLFFDMPYDVSAALDVLHHLCTKQKDTQSKLHLKFSDSVRKTLNRNLHKLAVLAPHIEGLYFEDEYVDDSLVKEISKCDNLRVIQLNLSRLKKVQWLTTAPKLEEIYIYRCVSVPKWNKYYKVMMMLLGQMEQLKKIYIRNNSRNFTEFGLDELDEERRKLAGAQKVKIYFKTDEPTNTGKLNATQCEFEKIEAVRVESESFNNPLVTEYLTTKGLSRFFYKHCLR